MKLDKQQKMIAYGAGALLLAFLAYRWYRARSTTTGATPADTLQTNPTDQASSDYAALAGSEQADVAGLQAQEQQDLAGLGSQESTDIAGLGQQETTDVSGLHSDIAGISGTLAGLTAAEQQLQNEIAAGHAQPAAAPNGPPGFAFGRTKPHAPAGHHYVGVGSGWWKLAKNTAAGAGKKPNPHSSNHQAGNLGHNGSAPAGHSVAPSSHAPKPTSIRKPSGGATVAPPPKAAAATAASRPPAHEPSPAPKPPPPPRPPEKKKGKKK